MPLSRGVVSKKVEGKWEKVHRAKVNADCVMQTCVRREVSNLGLKSMTRLKAFNVARVSAISLEPMRQITLSPSGGERRRSST